MKLLLDTTYFLPAIGISIKELPNDAPIKLIAKGHQISISDISIFELSAKGAKHITNGTLTPERVTRGIKAIIYDDTIETIPIHDNNLLLTSFKLREHTQRLHRLPHTLISHQPMRRPNNRRQRHPKPKEKQRIQ